MTQNAAYRRTARIRRHVIKYRKVIITSRSGSRAGFVFQILVAVIANGVVVHNVVLVGQGELAKRR